MQALVCTRRLSAPLIKNSRQAISQNRVRGKNRPTFSGGDVLCRSKAKKYNRTERSCLTRFKTTSQRLGAVLDYRNAIRSLEQARHIAHIAKQMNRHNRVQFSCISNGIGREAKRF